MGAVSRMTDGRPDDSFILQRNSKLLSILYSSFLKPKGSMADLEKWLEEILGRSAADWQIDPQSILALQTIREKNLKGEEQAQQLLEQIRRNRCEYEGELQRLGCILKELGVEERFISAPSQAYAHTLTECCSVLNEDDVGSGVEAAAAQLLLRQADAAPALAALKNQLEGVKADTLKLYGQLDRLGDAVKVIEKGSTEDNILTLNENKKLDFMLAKEKQYKTSAEKEESLLFKLTGGDDSLHHARVEELEKELHTLDKETGEARRQITGFLNLPPSIHLARVEIAKAEKELQGLTEQVQENISALHL